MYKLIVLFGPAGAGKDYILKKALEEIPLLHKPTLYTSRPMRQGEVDGVAYNFVDNDTFTEMLLDGTLIEASVFNHWGYGSAEDSYDKQKINILALGIDHLKDFIEYHSDIFEICPVFVAASQKTRLMRQLTREEDPNVQEIVRRFQSDEIDYSKDKIDSLAKAVLWNEELEDCVRALKSLRSLVESM